MEYLIEILPSLMNGALITLEVFFLVLVLSIPLGIVIAFIMRFNIKLLNYFINIYIWIMRGTPLLLQLIFIYYVLPSVGIRFDRLPAAIIAFTLNYAAYFAEIFRGGIESIPKGQYEAAKVLKFTQFQTIRYVILPQVIKIVLPSVFNEIMSLVKDTSLVYALGISDLILASRTAANRDASLLPMFVAGAIYLILIGIVTIVSKRVEKRYNYDRRKCMLELKNISKKFKDRQILSDFNLTVEENKILAIVGPSGGGKTTLLRMLAGLEKIDSGEIIYNGESLPIDELEKRNLLGFVFQDFQLFPHLTVLENLVLSPMKTMNMEKHDAEKKAIKLLEKLGLEKQINNYPVSLSGGQKQRVALARAMMIEPKIIGYDEPTSALDPELRLEVEKLILKNRELGITQIVVTHDLQFAENIADSILKVEPK